MSKKRLIAGLWKISGAGILPLLIMPLVFLFPCEMNDMDEVTVRGKLLVEKGPRAALQCPDKTIPLTSERRSISETLRDSRLSGRELKVTGQYREDGSFEVHEFFVVRSGSLYRVIYYCDVCNITTFSPGDCMCCQAPTVPVEVSPTDPRIFHEEIKGPPED